MCYDEPENELYSPQCRIAKLYGIVMRLLLLFAIVRCSSLMSHGEIGYWALSHCVFMCKECHAGGLDQLRNGTFERGDER